ncbi:Mfa1 family fimbria major subunit [uncultured Alistipes sp.]|jgi:hypothetical protein|uniref:Mfa1 family fimbria major subunit n=1 Tax=uncultured Alistipes sp. TaxID=538949 RepID=UPI0025FE88B6|nr:Mfa1 family fimbria major subunit [uncultured Alistipes sp.]
MKRIKTTLTHILLAAFMGSALTCCTSEVPEGGGKEGPDDGETAYLSITVRGATGMESRAGTDTGIPMESDVHTIRVVLYNAAHVAQEPLDFTDLHTSGQDFKGDDLVTGSSASKFTTVGRKVKKQDYQMVVILNPTPAIKEVTEAGSTLSEFNEAATIEREWWLGDDYFGFVMTNWQGLVNVDKDIYIREKKEQAEAAPVGVHVERALAKVVVLTPGGVGRAVPDYRYSVERWTLDVVNTKTTYMRTPWKAMAGGVEQAVESTDTDDRYQNYAKDPNVGDAANGIFHSYQAWLAAGEIGTAPAFKNPDFKYTDSSKSDNWERVGKKTDGTLKTYEYLYVVENTMEARHQYRDVTTSVLIRAQFIPFQSSISATPNMTHGDPYFVYYTSSDRYVFLASELEAEYQWQQANATSENPTSTEYQDPQIQDFMEHIKDYRDLLGSDVAFTTYAASAVSTELQYDFSFFDTNQRSYYRVPIRHYEDTEQPNVMQYGRFGVVRNNIYVLTINSIKGPGAVAVKPWPDTPPVTPPGPEEPEGPDEKEEGWISAEIQILDWVVREHGVSVGD